jgi:hypothetical protein
MENKKSDRIMPLEQQRRQYRVNFAINNNAIEGLFVSDELKELLKLWVNGEITLEEVEKKIYLLYLH